MNYSFSNKMLNNQVKLMRSKTRNHNSQVVKYFNKPHIKIIT